MKRAHQLALFGISAAGVAAFIFVRTRPLSLDAVSKIVIEAVLTEDVKALETHSSATPRAAAGLGSEVLQYLLAGIRKDLAGWKRLPDDSHESGQTFSRAAIFEKGDSRALLLINVNQTDDGPKAILHPQLMYFRYQLSHPLNPAKYPDTIAMRISTVQGLLNDSKKLQELGLKGFTGPFPGDPVDPISTFVARQKMVIEAKGVLLESVGLSK